LCRGGAVSERGRTGQARGEQAREAENARAHTQPSSCPAPRKPAHHSQRTQAVYSRAALVEVQVALAAGEAPQRAAASDAKALLDGALGLEAVAACLAAAPAHSAIGVQGQGEGSAAALQRAGLGCGQRTAQQRRCQAAVAALQGCSQGWGWVGASASKKNTQRANKGAQHSCRAGAPSAQCGLRIGEALGRLCEVCAIWICHDRSSARSLNLEVDRPGSSSTCAWRQCPVSHCATS
jgi:hypothetical protein